MHRRLRRSRHLRQTLQQRSGFPQFAELLVEFGDPVANVLQADRVRVPHGSAAIAGKTVAGDVNDVDIGGAQRVAFFQNARAFIDQM